MESSCSGNVFPYFCILLAVIVVTTGVRISAEKSNTGMIVCYRQSVVTNLFRVSTGGRLGMMCTRYEERVCWVLYFNQGLIYLFLPSLKHEFYLFFSGVIIFLVRL